MDISDTLAPNSDQLDAVDLLHSGPRTFTVASVSRGENAEQPVSVHLVEFPRVWRPGKSMRRVLAACWGVDASRWTYGRVRLFCDESVKFGGEAIGGTRISHLSGIDGVKRVPLLVARGRSATYEVRPLVESAEERVAGLRAEWKHAEPRVRKAIESEVARLTQASVAPGVDASPVPPAPQDTTQDTPTGDDDA